MDTQVKDGIPHYLLFVETGRDNNPSRWKFTLRGSDGNIKNEIADVEPGVTGERLDLLANIRALESLDQPSRVTLATCTQYVRQGVQYGVSEWVENDWQWEFFGDMVPIKNADLWRRMNHLLQVHSVQCRQYRIDGAHNTLPGPKMKMKQQPARTYSALSFAAEIWLKFAARIIPHALRERAVFTLQNLRRRLFRLAAVSKPCPGSG
jgi:ribonuclease HI